MDLLELDETGAWGVPKFGGEAIGGDEMSDSSR